MFDKAGEYPIIDIQKLSKSYKIGTGLVEALKGIDLKIYKGDSLAIMGASGSGKSTLLHLLGCLDTPTEGKYFLDQEDITTLSENQLAAIRAFKIGFVFQSFNLIAQLTVLENVAIPFLYQREESEAFVLEAITEALTRVGLSHRLHHHPSQLSGGEMQRVAIARALAIKPLLILADEPTGNLDSANGKAILNLFEELNAQGVTLVIVTHDPSVGARAKRLVKMQDGMIIEESRNIK